MLALSVHENVIVPQKIWVVEVKVQNVGLQGMENSTYIYAVYL